MYITCYYIIYISVRAGLDLYMSCVLSLDTPLLGTGRW